MIVQVHGSEYSGGFEVLRLSLGYVESVSFIHYITILRLYRTAGVPRISFIDIT